ncbi:DUF4249 domain-containing protein [Algoriphagus litoralis]|uniref:DUF4249 domain-containing protein n=1 Tax=Algoriphagus litoralis TaxID=2202829 RepID=UPI000DBA58F3|nr:DUF4249 domain-containing protein [Algoriphagus litoralis]
MINHIQRIVLWVSFLGLASCVDEINIALEESNQAMVIEAWIGNNPEDTYVKVYQTSAYISGVLNPNFVPVPVKSVVIEQGVGEDILFSQIEQNIFRQSTSFDPVSGRDYRLVVETADGEIYESSWEKMPPLVQIEDVVGQAFEKQVLIATGQSQFIQTRTFADIQAVISDPGEGELGYLIESSGITELYTTANIDNCACTCYENVPNIFAGMNVVSNEPFQGRSFGLSLGEISLSTLGRFLVNTKVKTVNKSSYDYLNQIDEQQRNSGSIFDPAPSRIKGNITKRGDENQLVLGSFFLFQESSYEKLLFRTQIRSEALELNHSIEPLPPVEASCLEVYLDATTIRPPAFRQ